MLTPLFFFHYSTPFLMFQYEKKIRPPFLWTDHISTDASYKREWVLIQICKFIREHVIVMEKNYAFMLESSTAVCAATLALLYTS